MFTYPFGFFGQGAYEAQAVRLDTSTYLTRGADLTGAVDTKEFLSSVYFRRRTATSGQEFNVHRNVTSAPGVFHATGEGTNLWTFQGRDTSNNVDLEVRATNTYLDTNWHHLLFSCDLATGSAWFYIDDVPETNIITANNDFIDVTEGEWGIGATPNGTQNFDLEMADCYLAFGTHLDLSVEANRRKFISATGKPVDLGDTGEKPTGSSPIIYLSVRAGEVAADFGTNKGTGGGFTTTGTITDAASSPSD